MQRYLLRIQLAGIVAGKNHATPLSLARRAITLSRVSAICSREGGGSVSRYARRAAPGVGWACRLGWVMVPVGGSGGVELNGEGVEYGELGRAAGHLGNLL